MSDVSIAPCRRLGQSRETSINDQSTLPLGAEIAITRQRFNDDNLDTRSIGPLIPCRCERDSTYRVQELRVEQRSLIGKKASEAVTMTSDLTAMHQLNLKMMKNAQDIEVKAEREYKYNLVWDPFMQAETFNPWT
jgi:hypothetical protein